MYVFIEPHYYNVDAIIRFTFVSRGIDFQIAGVEGWHQLNSGNPNYEAVRTVLMDRVIVAKPIIVESDRRKSRFDK